MTEQNTPIQLEKPNLETFALASRVVNLIMFLASGGLYTDENNMTHGMSSALDLFQRADLVKSDTTNVTISNGMSWSELVTLAINAGDESMERMQEVIQQRMIEVDEYFRTEASEMLDAALEVVSN